MPRSDDVPACIPETDVLDAVKEDAITALLDNICSQYEGTYPPQFMRCAPDERRTLAYKYLKARDWNMAAAMTMVTKTMAFRKERNADSMGLFPCAFPLRGFDEEDICCRMKESFTERWEKPHLWYRAMSPHHVTGYHYWDKEGHPVLYDFSGCCRVKELLDSVARVTPVGQQPKDTITSYHLYMNLVQEQLVRYANVVNVAKGGRCILGTTVVVNAEGLHIGMVGSEILRIVQATFQMDQEYFPEALHRLFVINCPAVVVHIFGLLKSSLDKNTQQKITFCNKAKSTEVLKKIIDEDKIPLILGGKCKCPGGCIPGIDGACYTTETVNESIQLTEDISIAAGKRHLVELKLEPNQKAAWNFRCTKARGGKMVDILFTAAFQTQEEDGSVEDSAESSSVVTQKPSSTASGSKTIARLSDYIISGKMSEGADHFIAKERGTLKLEWCNHDSWIHGKHLQLCIDAPEKHLVDATVRNCEVQVE